MKLSPAAHKWVRGLVDYGGLVVFLLGFFYNTKVAGLASREALVEATWWLVGGSGLALVVGLIFERRIDSDTLHPSQSAVRSADPSLNEGRLE